MTMQPDTAELRRLLTEATPGPWGAKGMNFYGNHMVLGTSSAVNADLIVAAVNALPGLLDRIEELEAVADAARELVESLGPSLRPHRLHEALARLDGGEEK